jgi:hypothetical protein
VTSAVIVSARGATPSLAFGAHANSVTRELSRTQSSFDGQAISETGLRLAVCMAEQRSECPRFAEISARDLVTYFTASAMRPEW